MADDQLSATFAALADPTRRAILARLSDGEATVDELAAPFPISVQAVSQHLRVLERAGLIERGRTAQLRPSRLRGAPLEGRRRLARALPPLLGRRASTGWRSGCGGDCRDAEHGMNVTRVFDAPRERVWREWTRARGVRRLVRRRPSPRCPSRACRWTCGRAARGARRCSPARTRREIRWKGEYREVDEPERLVFTIADRAGRPVRARHRRPRRPRRRPHRDAASSSAAAMSPEEYERAKTGWGGFFDRIAERLAA